LGAVTNNQWNDKLLSQGYRRIIQGLIVSRWGLKAYLLENKREKDCKWSFTRSLQLFSRH